MSKHKIITLSLLQITVTSQIITATMIASIKYTVITVRCFVEAIFNDTH